MSSGAHTATSDTRGQVLDGAARARGPRYDRLMPSALVQQIMDREGCSEREAEFIAVIELGLIDGDECKTNERPGP